MVRQCRQRGYEPTIITHHEPIADVANELSVQWRSVSSHNWICETLLHSSWNDRTIVLLGDVVYSKTVMNRVFNCKKPFNIFGNEHEIYALAFTKQQWPKVIKSLGIAIEHAKLGNAGTLRKMYQAYCGLDLNGSEWEDKVLDWVCNVQDYTTDFDTVVEYQDFVRKRITWLDDL
jgi:hypothetical protein